MLFLKKDYFFGTVMSSTKQWTPGRWYFTFHVNFNEEFILKTQSA